MADAPRVDDATPIEVFAQEAERVGFRDLDPKSLLYGFLLGRDGPPYTRAKVRWLAETLLSDRQGPHLPRPGDG